jgi:hypothetical protein
MEGIKNNFNEKQISIICSSINIFGGTQHPSAEPCNIEFFVKEYILKCLRKGLKQCKTEFKEEVKFIIDMIKHDFCFPIYKDKSN